MPRLRLEVLYNLLSFDSPRDVDNLTVSLSIQRGMKHRASHRPLRLFSFDHDGGHDALLTRSALLHA